MQRRSQTRLLAVLFALVFAIFQIFRPNLSLPVQIASDGQVPRTDRSHLAPEPEGIPHSKRSHSSWKTEDTLSEKDQASTQKSTLYLHVGPPKTATTLIQCALCASNLDSNLLDDNIVFLGTCPYRACGLKELPDRFLAHRYNQFFPGIQLAKEVQSPSGPFLFNVDVIESNANRSGQPSDLSKINERLLSKLDAIHLEGWDAFIVYEGFSMLRRAHLKALSEALKPTWEVVVITVYRRLYDWLPSRFNSKLKWKVKSSWPSPEVPSIPAFDLEGSQEIFQVYQTIESQQMHPTEVVRVNFGRYFPNIRIIDLHHLEQGRNRTTLEVCLLEHLFCTTIQTATHTCQSIRGNQWDDAVGETRKNPTVPLDFDRVAVAAYRAGLLKHVSRPLASNVISLFDKKNGLPRSCLSERKLARLGNLSLTLEIEILGTQNDERMHSDHRLGFESAISSGKYCAVNVSETLMMKLFHTFLNNNLQYKGGLKLQG